VALLLLFAAFNRSSGADQTEQPFKSRTDIRQQAEVTVRAAVLTDDESERYFGASRGWRLDEPFDLHSVYRTVRAFLFGSEYLNAPISPLYVFGRQQDVALQKARDTVSERNHLRLWLAPFAIDGLQVWVGQISRDIGIKLTTQSWYLTTHVISADVDQDRFYLVQDLILSGAVARFGFVRGVGVSSIPRSTRQSHRRALFDRRPAACFVPQ
jgi:hypothetical protein